MTDAVEIYQDDRATRRAIAEIRQAPMTVGDAWKSGSQIDWGAVALSVTTAAELGLAPRSNYHLFPVIKGQVWPMAEACRILLRRHGGDLTFTADSPQECTVVVTGPRPDCRTYPPFTVTGAEASSAGWGSSGLLSKDPRAILRARASRRAILLYCPEVMAGPPPDRWGDWHNDPGPEAVEEVPATGPEPLAAAPRPSAVSGTTKEKIRAALDRLTPGQRHTVVDLWRREQLPIIDALDLDQFMAALGIILDVIADDRPPADSYEEPDPDRDDDADNYRYAAPEDDPGRPF